MTLLRLISYLFVFALSACGGDDRSAPRAAVEEDVEALPAPVQSAGSVTGMPDAPGPGNVPLGGVQPGTATVDGVAMVVPITGMPGDGGLPPLEDNPEAGLIDLVDLTAAPPTVPTLAQVTPVTPSAAPAAAVATAPAAAEAVAIVHAYYAAIASGQHARAYALWSDGGRSSGQTPEQFAAGFAGTRSVVVRPGEPGAVAGAGDARLVEVPVSVTTTLADGSERRDVGAYVLRRLAGDGAGAWRITSAELREYQP